MADNEELLDYEEEENPQETAAGGKADAGKKGYVGIHSTSFKDMLLKEPLFDAIQRCGFEHPSEGAVGLRAARPAHSACAGRGDQACCCRCCVSRAHERVVADC
jgi:hypothetical protein